MKEYTMTAIWGPIIFEDPKKGHSGDGRLGS